MNHEACFSPIQGISLERYAELGAATADASDDPAKVAAIIEAEGVALADWEAAKTGWTERMQDISLMGRVATAFMPLYQQALAKMKGGRATASYEDFVAVSAAIKVLGYEIALKACRVSSSDWTEVSGYWTSQMSARMMEFAGHHDAISREEARLRGGGEPRAIDVKRGVAPARAPAAPVNPHGATLPSAGQMPAMTMNVGMGFGLQQAAAFLSGGVVPGAPVVVIHPTNQQRYQARVLSATPQHTLVQFANGAQQWVPSNAVRAA